MRNALFILKVGIGLATLAGAVLATTDSALSKSQEVAGSTQRFRGTASAPVSTEKERTQAAMRTKVGLEQAIQAATQKVPGKVVGAELKEREMVYWDVDILSIEGKEIHLSVDATTGNVLEAER